MSSQTPLSASLPRRAAAWLVAVVLCAAGLPAAIAQTAAESGVAARPKIALVLSGGGARGMAHLGVLRVLEELRVPVDIVVGTSFGAIVGGAYAGGAEVDQLERLVRATDWSRVLQDRPPREDLSYRRREDDTLVSSRLEFGVGRSGLTLPRGAFSSAEVEQLLRQLTPAATLLKVTELPLVFRAVATDMLTGEMVTPTDVALFTAMRASMSVPGAFAPITVDGRVLGDGGLVSNLPVQLARDLGAEVLIAVNLGTPLSGPEALSSALGMAQQMLNILTEQNVTRSLRELAPRDVLITPDLTGVQFMDFSQVPRSVEAGAAAARAQAGRLAQWSVTPAQFESFRQRRTAQHVALTEDPPSATAVRVEPRDALGQPLPAPIAASVKPGDPVGPATINRAAAQMAREFDAERVDVLVIGEGAGREVVLLPIASPLGRARLRLGMDLFTDFGDTSQFTISGLYTLTGLNDWGAEWRNLLRGGAVNEAQTEWYQPLGRGAPWFAAARAAYRNADALVYDNFKTQAVVAVVSSAASLAVGRRIADLGQARIGFQRRAIRLRSAIPDMDPTFSGTETSIFGDVTLDTLDSLGFPSRGYLLSAAAEYFGQVSDEANTTLNRFSSRFDGLYAAQQGPWAGHVYMAGLRSALNLTQGLALGGFLRLSGAPTDSVFGEQIVFGRAVLARQVGTLPAAVGGAMRLGLSVEAGKASGGGVQESGRTRYAGSLFAKAETRFGPIFVAVGHTAGLGTAAYLFLGSVLLPSGLLR
ncbi:MAG: patatin-like phospholipase family protein [Burkholderiales bacterium]|nr:patatin-like phospholipase family protein [Burkholderiales bacterium]